MPTARQASGAVHIPKLGDLVLGGYSEDRLRTAELLQTAEGRDDSSLVWKEISPMIERRKFLSAVYFDMSVIVVSKDSTSMELLSLPGNRPGQWTLVTGCTTPSDRPCSMCVFKERILLAGLLKTTEVN